MGIIEAFEFGLIVVVCLTVWCSCRMAKRVSAPLKAKGSRWALPAGIVAFILNFAIYSVGIFLVLSLAFSR